METTPLLLELQQKMDAYWRAANYLSVGQIYLYDNPLLNRPLRVADVKHMLLGHWGTTPGQNFIYVHLNRVIKQYDLEMVYISGPGHGGPAWSVTPIWRAPTVNAPKRFSGRVPACVSFYSASFRFRAGIPSHDHRRRPGRCTRAVNSDIRSATRLAPYSTIRTWWPLASSAMAKPESGPLATAWHSNKFLNPASDGAVLPILHLNGYKISNPTIIARITREELEQLLCGYGWTLFRRGTDPCPCTRRWRRRSIRYRADRRSSGRAHPRGRTERPRWPMIVLHSPKGWTDPKMVDGQQVEGTFRARTKCRCPIRRTHPVHLKLLEDWLLSYRPEELFDKQGRLKAELAELAPKGARRMGANPHANGGILLRDLRMPDFREYGVDVPAPGVRGIGDTHVLGPFLRDVAKLNGTDS